MFFIFKNGSLCCLIIFSQFCTFSFLSCLDFRCQRAPNFKIKAKKTIPRGYAWYSRTNCFTKKHTHFFTLFSSTVTPIVQQGHLQARLQVSTELAQGLLSQAGQFSGMAGNQQVAADWAETLSWRWSSLASSVLQLPPLHVQLRLEEQCVAFHIVEMYIVEMCSLAVLLFIPRDAWEQHWKAHLQYSMWLLTVSTFDRLTGRAGSPSTMER